jgi:alpha,alpha-trehalase
LLYKTEKDLQAMAETLVTRMTRRNGSSAMRGQSQKYLWDPARRLFFDYDFQTGVRSNYEYITTSIRCGLARLRSRRRFGPESGIFEQRGGWR